MARHWITLDELRALLHRAKEKITLEKQIILSLHPLPDSFSRDRYAFAYKRAEGIGLRAINRRLNDISWLPMQLDAQSEIVPSGPKTIKRWLTSSIIARPSAEEFGNDFIHSLARTGLEYGWDDPETADLTDRIGLLFRDLSCLIGLIYYSTLLAENGTNAIALHNPHDLCQSVADMAALAESPDIAPSFHAHNQITPTTTYIAPILRVVESIQDVDPVTV